MITPISLESDIEIIKQQLDTLRRTNVDRFHIDIIDGLFADNVTVSPADLQELDLTGIKLDLHLLVDDPTEWIEECIALKPDRIFAQIERMGNIEYFVSALQGYGQVRIGLGLGISTPLSSLSDSVLRSIDSVLLMAIEPGFSGQKFNPTVLRKIYDLRARWDGTIAIDGGINPQTYVDVLTAGAREAGANTALWKGTFEDNLKKFNEAEDLWRKK